MNNKETYLNGSLRVLDRARALWWMNYSKNTLLFLPLLSNVFDSFFLDNRICCDPLIVDTTREPRPGEQVGRGKYKQRCAFHFTIILFFL